MNARDRTARKKRRAKQAMSASALVGFSPIFEFIMRHETFGELLTPNGIGHMGLLGIGAAGVWWAARIHAEATEETGTFVREDFTR